LKKFYKTMKKHEIRQIFEILSLQNPNAKIELIHENAFTLLIAVVLSAQATDKQVNKITPAIFAEVKAPKDLLEKGEKWLFERVKSINYNNSKAKNLMKAALQLQENFGGIVPSTREELETLAGVGRKSANVILNSIFKQPTMPVDTHIFRISNRIGLVKAKNVLETEEKLLKIVPKEFGLSAHHLLVLHGRYVCKAIKPDCKNCKIKDLCKFEEKPS
jgi:endonuclease-3